MGEQHFEDMQRVNQKWFNLFWGPFIRQQQQQQEKHEDQERKREG
ncbi:MAG: hypothetical protein WA395_10775 [Nitrososphaeraceae archaeon]